MNEAELSPNDSEAPADRINPVVFYGSAIAIVAFAIWTMFFTDRSQAVINTVLGWISDTFGWFYIAAVAGFLLLILFLAQGLYWSCSLIGITTPRRCAIWPAAATPSPASSKTCPPPPWPCWSSTSRCARPRAQYVSVRIAGKRKPS